MSDETFLGFPVKRVDKIEGMPDKVTMVVGTPSDMLKFPIHAGDLGPLPPVVPPNVRVAYQVQLDGKGELLHETLDVVASSIEGAMIEFWSRFNPYTRWSGSVTMVIIQGVERI